MHINISVFGDLIANSGCRLLSQFAIIYRFELPVVVNPRFAAWILILSIIVSAI